MLCRAVELLARDLVIAVTVESTNPVGARRRTVVATTRRWAACVPCAPVGSTEVLAYKLHFHLRAGGARLGPASTDTANQIVDTHHIALRPTALRELRRIADFCACALGAHCVEHPDATTGIPAWDAVWERVNAGWPRRAPGLALDGWTQDTERGLWFGPGDPCA